MQDGILQGELPVLLDIPVCPHAHAVVGDIGDPHRDELQEQFLTAGFEQCTFYPVGWTYIIAARTPDSPSQ